MNMNWLGFSLSPQDQDDQLQLAAAHDQHQDPLASASRLGLFNSSHHQQLHGECFDDELANSTASLNHHLLPPPSNFGMLQPAFNHHIHSQDGNIKGAGMNSSNSNGYKKTSSSDLSTMLMGSSSATSNSSCTIMSQQANLEDHHQQQQPKLENFLGQHYFGEHDRRSNTSRDYMFDINNVSNTTNSNNNLGLSMIKTWLRNQPPQMEPESKNRMDKTTKQQTSSLSLSMSTPTAAAINGETSCSSDKNTKQSAVVIATTTTEDAQTTTQTSDGAVEPAPRKAIDTFGQRTSIYRGVTRHRWTGRYEAHLWDNSCRREGQTRKGRQVYLGGYDKEDKAARSYDLAALKYWGTTTTTNFPISCYEKEIEEMKPMTRQEYVASLRRKSSGFSRGASIYRGVTRHHQHGRWQARIGRVAGNKDLYLGTFSTQEEAAEAYDIAAIKFRGLNAVTNFDMSRYDVKSILESSALPITTGAAAKRLKEQQQQQQQQQQQLPADHHGQMMLMMKSSAEHDMMSNMYSASYGAQQGCSWPGLAFNQPQQAQVAHQAPFAAGMQLHYSPYGYGYSNANAQRVWCKQEQDTNSNQESSVHRQQLQMGGGGTHNFFHDHNHQQPSCGVMGLMDSSSAAAHSKEHSSGSNSVIYGSAAAGDHHHPAGNSSICSNGTTGGYIMSLQAMSRIEEQHQGNINGFGDGDDDHNMYLGSTSTATDFCYQQHHTSSNRNSYYHLPLPDDDQHESSSSVALVTGTRPSSSATCNMSWVPTAVSTVAHKTFTVWNDA